MAVQGTDQGSQIRDAMERAQRSAGGDKQQSSRDKERGEDTRNDRNDRTDRRNDRRDEERNQRHASRRDENRPAGEDAPRREATGRFTSLSQIGRANQLPLAMSNTAEALETFRRDFVEAMPTKEDNNMLVVNVFPIDSAIAGLPFSMLVVAGQRRDREQLGVGYHTFILAGSAERLMPRDDSFRGNRVTIVQVPGDAYRKPCRDVIKEVLSRHYGELPLLTADAEVIHSAFPSAKDSPEAIADCVKNSYAAIKTAISRVDPDAPVLQLDPEENKDTYNTIHVQHRQNHIFDRGDMPIRADVILDFQSRENRGRHSRDPIDQLVTGRPIARVGGYFDLVYAADGVGGRNDLYPRRGDRRGDDEHHTYALRFIQTFCDTIDFAPATTLLAMAAMNAVGEPNELMRAFEPNPDLGEDDTRNIGVLAIESNLQDMDRGFGERMDTKTSTFTKGKRMSLLRSTIRPGIIYSIDVPECGAATWQWADWMAAADGNQKAMDRIYDAACYMTSGYFEEYFRRTDPMIDSHVERIHAGYYTEGPGTSRLDIRDLDYIALLNLLRPEKEEDLVQVERWGIAATMNEDDVLSQSDRYGIIKDMLPTAVFTGFFSRYNLLNSFNEALVNAVTDCRLSLNPTSSSRDSNDRYRTSYGNIDQILSRPGSNGLYRHQRQSRDRFDDRYDRDDRDDRRGGRNGDRW